MILAILQARVNSTRLPRKVLFPILGEPMFVRQLERIQAAKRIDKIIVATSTNKADDELVKICEQYNIECYRGSLDDVLDRYYQAGLLYNPDHVVRLTGDCPLTDPNVIDKVIEAQLEGAYDYTSNTVIPTYPDGLDVEIFTWETLKRTWREATLLSQREHVTLYIYQHPELFTINNVENLVDLSDLRWTVDENEDFLLVKDIYEHLYYQNSLFTMDQVLQYVKNHQMLLPLNNQYTRNEGLLKSLQQDK